MKKAIYSLLVAAFVLAGSSASAFTFTTPVYPISYASTYTPAYTYSCYLNLTANGSSSSISVSYGSPVVLSWSTSGCSSASVIGPGVNSGNLSNTVTIYPASSSQYAITAYDYNGTQQTQSVYVSVIQNQYNAYPYTYPYNCSISSFSASQTYVTSGYPVTLSWSTSNCYSVSISNIGNVSTYGSKVVYPAYNSGNYVLTAYGSNGVSQTQSVYITVQNNNVLAYNYANTNVVTTVATNISKTSAQLNGLITNPNYYNTNVYFEYGTTVNLGLRTASMLANGNSSFSENLTGLASDTIYYFRAVSQGSNGTYFGTIEIFQTPGVAVPAKQVVVQGPTVTGEKSPIMLKIENKYESISEGDTVDYTVSYKNIGKTTLVHPMLQVVAPKGITLTNSSSGTYSSDTNTLTIPLNDLANNANDVIYVQGKVSGIPSGTSQVVTTALLVYTNANGAQENAMAYALNKIKDNASSNTLTASAFGSGIFPTSLIGWLIIIICIMGIVFIARKISAQSRANAYNNSHTPLPPNNIPTH
ncbi:MAG TPA: hypothetical protein VMR49_02545 [Candidatus Paceibacterota bacterium]|nr:hypothetical protein [Candidatus Paceibacterota bacterium]